MASGKCYTIKQRRLRLITKKPEIKLSALEKIVLAQQVE